MSLEYWRSPEGQKQLKDSGFVDVLTEQIKREQATKNGTTQQNDILDTHAPEDISQTEN